MTFNDVVGEILANASIDADLLVETDNGPQTAFQIVEAAILGAIETIEDA